MDGGLYPENCEIDNLTTEYESKRGTHLKGKFPHVRWSQMSCQIPQVLLSTF